MMVASDLLVVAASVLAGDAFVLRFLTGISGVFTTFIFVEALVGVPMLLLPTRDNLASPEAATESDRAMLATPDAFMNDKNIYTDSNLTLARVARRLSVPVRDVSTAINRITGENFPRYINGFRVRHAQDALRKTELPITEVMSDAGFVSKSSFNTEFRGITGQTPSQFRSGREDATQPVRLHNSEQFKRRVFEPNTSATTEAPGLRTKPWLSLNPLSMMMSALVSPVWLLITYMSLRMSLPRASASATRAD
ncbi:helix-turn-helix domain-containing protein [Sulfitobacter sp. SK012]|uniref:helix-turn-helix domain-containing protein n=1 Tax=Sulfitobacter sp. SK012 TaxID=1389005 RepID=UPI0020C79F3E|nr:AraC family transcriptional regulator [Sulfitobacter sp. SK012]